MGAFSLEGSAALITGGGTGIGLAIAQAMVRAGARVVLVGRRREVLERACSGLGEPASFLCQDVSKLSALPELVRRAEAASGPVDILVNNAGVHLKKDALETSDGEFLAVLQTNLLAVYALSRECAGAMVRRGSGSIIMIVSMASLFGIPRTAAYTAAKSALTGLVRELATELSPRGVRVNAIAPGFIDTDMARQALEGDPQRLDRVLQRTPMGRLGRTEEVGQAAVFLAAPAAGFITGTVLPVDGGVSIGF